MYSPSGSKRVQLKRNRACGGLVVVVEEVVCWIVYTEHLTPPTAPLPFSVSLPVGESRDPGWPGFLNQSEVLLLQQHRLEL